MSNGGEEMSRYIDADKLYELIRTNDYRLATINGSIDYGMFTIGIKQAIDEIPTADVTEVRHGKWLTWEEQFPNRKPTKKNNLGVFCNNCHSHADNMTDYCPNCGARMDGKE